MERKIIPYTAYLDAKTAFDVVSHNSLMRKLFNAGVEGKLWSLIMNFHQDASSVVKWEGRFSSTFPILQGVRQGGILSADLYKLYVNQLLNRLEYNSTGGRIGDIVCNAPTCADDLSTLSDSERSLQVLCNIAYDYSVMEQYQLQPTKSVVLPIQTGRKKIQQPSCFLGGQPMPVVDKTVHVGVTRITSNKPSGIIEENIQKARRTMYSLMATGLHGRNGLDPETSIHIMKIYVIPVLTYGLEIYLPTSSELKTMDIFFKKTLKHILSLPVTTADPAPYVLSGFLPVEGLIHQKALTLFGNVARLDAEAIEKKIAIRQLSLKSLDSRSWFVAVDSILTKYDLPNGLALLHKCPTKARWKTMVTTAVNRFWMARIVETTETYTSLQYLSSLNFKPGKIHPILRLGNFSARDANRIPVKSKMLTGTYLLQSNRAAFNNVQVDPTCMLCKESEETLTHFILECSVLDSVRKPILEEITLLLEEAGVDFVNSSSDTQLQLILDHHKLIKCASSIELEHHCRRLCYALHCSRYSYMFHLPTRKRHGL